MAYSKTGGKGAKIVLFAYFILALIGSSAISAGEAFYLEWSDFDSLSSGRYFASINHSVDLFATEVLSLRKARGCSNSPLRNDMLRVFLFAGTIAMAIHLVVAKLKSRNDNIPIIKNLVPLKLLI